ncbi:hypothetical protein [uncultured Winogradskyella sp.]|uniref:hypothetical protein n=1 Tax=uncultured Winogradskyella sp. TaxID=395353 RepID=UPI0030EB9A6E|tara:strand:+ start:440 stop:958 length:519 start_codon:yes stop_codon:yes gene_type:complete
MDNKDEILIFLSKNRNKPFNQRELQKHLLTELNVDQVKELLYQIISFNQNLMKVSKESSIGVLPVQYSGIIDDFISNGGFTRIESDLNSKRNKELERESKQDQILDLDLKLKLFESKIGKRIKVSGFIILVLSFLITVLTIEFWSTDDSNPKQESQVIDKQLSKGQPKLKDS